MKNFCENCGINLYSSSCQKCSDSLKDPLTVDVSIVSAFIFTLMLITLPLYVEYLRNPLWQMNVNNHVLFWEEDYILTPSAWGYAEEPPDGWWEEEFGMSEEAWWEGMKRSIGCPDGTLDCFED